MNILKKIWLYKAKKQIIEKYNQFACDKSMDMFMKDYHDYEMSIFSIHTNLVRVMRDIDNGINRSWYVIPTSVNRSWYNIPTSVYTIVNIPHYSNQICMNTKYTHFVVMVVFHKHIH